MGERDHDYYDFVDLFREAAMEQMMAGGGPVEARRQAKALEWISACSARGEDFEETGEPVFLAESRGELEAPLTPLAWAVDQGLTLVAAALLREGANPGFSFEALSENGSSIRLGIADLARGWSDSGYRAQDCAALLFAALERQEIEPSADLPDTGSARAPKAL